MRVLSIGSAEFQSFIRKVNHSQTWDVVYAHCYEEVEDQLLVGAFQAMLIDVEDDAHITFDLLALVSKLTPPFASIGFTAEELNIQHRAFFKGAVDVCFRKDAIPDLLKMQCDSVIRLAHGHKTPAIQVENVCLDVDTQIVTVSGTPVNLCNREYQLLELLFTNANRIISVERFFDQVYGYEDPPSTKIFDVLICKVRKKLRSAGLSTNIIQTRWGQGYSVSCSNQRAELKAA